MRYWCKLLHLAIGFVHKMNLHEHVSFRSSIQLGTVKADDLLSDDPNKQKRNLSFQSRVMDVSVGFEFNFFEFAGCVCNSYF